MGGSPQWLNGVAQLQPLLPPHELRAGVYARTNPLHALDPSSAFGIFCHAAAVVSTRRPVAATHTRPSSSSSRSAARVVLRSGHPAS
jgi:hypothetical protein